MLHTRQPSLAANHPECAAAAQSLESGSPANRTALSYDPLVPTIFHEEWWLQAATRGRFDVAEVTAGGRTVGRLPFYVRESYGLRELRMPPATYFLGPATDEGEGNSSNRFLKRMDLTRTLIQKLPRTVSQYIKCHAGIQDVIAFQEQKFRTYVQFTYEITPKPVDVLWCQMRNKTRNVIRRAGEQLSVRELDDVSKFAWTYERNLASRRLKNEIDGRVCSAIVSAAINRKRGRIMAAYNQTNKMVAAIFCAWDSRVCYYTLSTRAEDAGNGATSLLIWESVKDAAQRDLKFDFAGLGSQGSILLYTGFGGTISPRYAAVRERPLARIMSQCKSMFIGENFFY